MKTDSHQAEALIAQVLFIATAQAILDISIFDLFQISPFGIFQISQQHKPLSKYHFLNNINPDTHQEAALRAPVLFIATTQAIFQISLHNMEVTSVLWLHPDFVPEHIAGGGGGGGGGRRSFLAGSESSSSPCAAQCVTQTVACISEGTAGFVVFDRLETETGENEGEREKEGRYGGNGGR